MKPEAISAAANWSGLTPALVAAEWVILALLVLLGLLTLSIFTWRYRAVRQEQGRPAIWRERLTRPWTGGEDALDLALSPDKTEENVPARLIRTCMAHWQMAPEALEKVLEAQALAERRELEKGAAFLATVGSNAPFIGLTGTVLGILAAFNGFAAAGGGGGAEMMSAIARALVATALGLVVAIPAVIGYNLLRTRIRGVLDGHRELSALLVARSLDAASRREA